MFSQRARTFYFRRVRTLSITHALFRIHRISIMYIVICPTEVFEPINYVGIAAARKRITFLFLRFINKISRITGKYTTVLLFRVFYFSIGWLNETLTLDNNNNNINRRTLYENYTIRYHNWFFFIPFSAVITPKSLIIYDLLLLNILILFNLSPSYVRYCCFYLLFVLAILSFRITEVSSIN